MKSLLLLAATLFAMPSAQAFETNVRWHALDVVGAHFTADVQFKAAEKFSIGPLASFNPDGTWSLGAAATLSLSDSIFNSSWIFLPGLAMVRDGISKKKEFIALILFGYQWVFESGFNIAPALGFSYDTQKTSDDLFLFDVRYSIALGWAF